MTDNFDCKPGYYVEDEYFGTKVHQARASARRLANLFGRPVEVIFQGADGQLSVSATYSRGGDVTVVTPQDKPYRPASVEYKQGTIQNPADLKTGGL